MVTEGFIDSATRKDPIIIAAIPSMKRISTNLRRSARERIRSRRIAVARSRSSPLRRTWIGMKLLIGESDQMKCTIRETNTTRAINRTMSGRKIV
jgi:hypothetical protein